MVIKSNETKFKIRKNDRGATKKSLCQWNWCSNFDFSFQNLNMICVKNESPGTTENNTITNIFWETI